jgi:hypothetical protein
MNYMRLQKAIKFQNCFAVVAMQFRMCISRWVCLNHLDSKIILEAVREFTSCSVSLTKEFITKLSNDSDRIPGKELHEALPESIEM